MSKNRIIMSTYIQWSLRINFGPTWRLKNDNTSSSSNLTQEQRNICKSLAKDIANEILQTQEQRNIRKSLAKDIANEILQNRLEAINSGKSI